ncbi:response regulator transcription factor [Paenibacillus eucommiae]|uniref:Two-component system response regulator YesN n=1 Tax=Paenibacillus eucommiae TaxID=1355755 RepID=A0ABS4IVG7_9BACL|nr:response regulator [Paenibacillus eucommiae]MBP1991580.1 two-component system response regulator YesN [Paenibacillus eucommiae]
MAQLLIVDDEAHVVERLAELVPWEQIGIASVHKAYSAYEALELLSLQAIDIVITDIRMPGMSGLELSEHIRNKCKKTKCILLSGHAEFEYAKEAILHGTASYLLKPVSDEELLATVSRVLQTLREEWNAIISQERIARTLRENLPQLRSTLLSELLLGKRYSESDLQDKMAMLGVPDFFGKSFSLLLVRLEKPFYGYEQRSLALVEYAVGNMAEELFAPNYKLWYGKDTHDYLVFVMTTESSESCEAEQQQLTLERTAAQLQDAIHTYLKGEATVLISGTGTFPQDLSAQYDGTLWTLRRRVGAEQDLILTVSNAEQERTEVRSIASLYELPTLAQLLEAGQWAVADQRLERIFEELRSKRSEVEELLLEAYFAIASAAAYYAHKNGRPLSGLIGAGYDKLLQGVPYRSVEQLEDWTTAVMSSLRSETESETKDSRTKLIASVQQFVEQHLADDVSLTAIAVHVYMHPVYISKIYKLETGENVSDYVYRLRMEKAVQMLLHTPSKIYEIAASIGYQRAHSFIHVFKKHTGLTPQEYRDMYALQ